MCAALPCRRPSCPPRPGRPQSCHWACREMHAAPVCNHIHRRLARPRKHKSGRPAATARAPGNTACMRRALPLTATGARAHHRKHGMHTRVPGSMACTQNIAMGNTKSGECWRAVGNQATKVGQQCEERGTSALARRARRWRLAPWSAHLVSEQLDLTKTTSSNRGAALFVVDETAGSSKRGIAL